MGDGRCGKYSLQTLVVLNAESNNYYCHVLKTFDNLLDIFVIFSKSYSIYSWLNNFTNYSLISQNTSFHWATLQRKMK